MSSSRLGAAPRGPLSRLRPEDSRVARATKYRQHSAVVRCVVTGPSGRGGVPVKVALLCHLVASGREDGLRQQFCWSTEKMLHHRRPLHAEGDEGNSDCREIAARRARRARRAERAAARDRVLLCRGHGNSGSGSTLSRRDATLLRSRERQGASHSNQREMRANWNQGRKCKVP